MNSNMQAYLKQLKDAKLIDLVQSQSPSIINQVIQSYTNEGEDFRAIKMKEVDGEGSTVLHRACLRGLAEIIEILLVNGCDVNATNNGGESPILIAAKRGNPVVLKMLKDFGADINIVDLKGQNLAHCAIYNDNVYVLLWIETSTEISLNSKDIYGHTPLHLSCIYGKVNSMKFLLRKSRSNLEERTSQSRDTCLHLAILNNQLQCIPYMMLKFSMKESIFQANHIFEEDNSSIIHCKNANNKTPVDLFMDLPYDYRVSHRFIWYLFLIIQMTSLSLVKLNLNICRLFLFLFPFLGFLFGVVLAWIFPHLNIWIFIVTSFLCCSYVRMQSHRTNQIDTRPNPIFAGAYLAGISHDIICFLVNIYPKMRGDEWEIILTVVSFALFVVAYITLVFTDPGQLKISQTSPINFSEFLDHEVKMQKLTNHDSNSLPLDKFCTVCEVSPSIGNVKHCKLCEMCIVDMDHHCLFLMTCISVKNLRNFLFVIFLSMLLMALFIETCLNNLILRCGSLYGANPVEFMMCSYKKQPWISTAVIFNGISCIWVALTLRFHLAMISFNSTAYFHSHAKRSTRLQRLSRVFYFLVQGSFYHCPHETNCI